MAQVTFTPIEPGDKAIANPVSAFFTDAETQSGNVQDANLRTEGVDRRSIQDASVVTQVSSAKISSNTAVVYHQGGSGTINLGSQNPRVISSGGTDLQITDLGTVDCTSEVIRVRWSVCLRSAQIHSRGRVRLYFELWSQIDGSIAALPKTKRRIQWRQSGNSFADPTVGLPREMGCASVCGVHLLGVTGNIEKLSLRAGIEYAGSGDVGFEISEASLVATRFKH